MAKPLQLAEDIIPINEFKTNASRLIRQMQDTQRPVVITQNGRPSAVVLTPEEFDSLSYASSFARAVADGLADADADRIHSTKDVMAEIRRSLDSKR